MYTDWYAVALLCAVSGTLLFIFALILGIAENLGAIAAQARR